MWDGRGEGGVEVGVGVCDQWVCLAESGQIGFFQSPGKVIWM